MRLSRRVVSFLLSFPVIIVCAAAPPVPSRAVAPGGASGGPGARPGELLYVARTTTVRTRGGGNLSVDLPAGRAVVLVELRADDAILEPSPSDADLLRQFGVRRVPRYRVSRLQLQEDFLDEAAWRSRRAAGMDRLRRLWPELAFGDLERILLGEPFVGMTRDQAEEAVGGVIFFREPSTTSGAATAGGEGGRGDEETWTIGRRSRAAELRAFTEGRERGLRAATFEQWLRRRARAVLRLRAGRVVAVETPEPDPE